MLDDLIGVGRMTSVYAATDPDGARFAVKVLHAPLGEMREIRARFRRDGWLPNLLGGHPGVVSTFADGVDPEDGAPFLVQELVDGVTIDRRADLDPLDAEQLLELAEQVLAVLAAAHAAGIVNHGLEPRDLLVSTEGRVRVLDLGVARALDLERAGGPTLCPTWGRTEFLAPEQILSQTDAVGPATDLWSLGAVLYALASGEPPHGISCAPCLWMATSRARPLASRAPHLPRSVSAIVDRALSVRPDARWRTASEMLAAVRDARRSSGLAASPGLLAAPHSVTSPDPKPPITEVRARFDTQPPLRRKESVTSSRM